MNQIKLYSRFLKVYIKGLLEYRFAFFMDVFVNAFTHLVGFLNIWILLKNFTDIGGWSYYEIMFLYSVNLLPFGIAGLFIWAPMVNLEQMVRDGSFDSILIKPLSPFAFMICKGFQHTFLGHIVVAIILFCSSIKNSNYIQNPRDALLVGLILVCAFIIHSCMMVIISSLSFWIVKTNTLFEIVIYNVRNFVNYPLSIYNIFIRALLTFLIPYAFVNYYPLSAVKNIQSGDSRGFFLLIISVGVTMLILGLTCGLWKKGIQHYNSTGS